MDATLPTPGADIDTWGPELNAYLIELTEMAEQAVALANAAAAAAQQILNLPPTILAQATAQAELADLHEDNALAALAAAQEAAALAQTIADGIDDAALPPGGTDGQFLMKDSAATPVPASWQDPPGNVLSVNGASGDVVLTAEDIGALADDYVAPVTSVNGDTGAVTLNAADVGATTSGDVSTIITGHAAILALQAASHSHSNATILNNTTESFTTALKTKLDGIATGAQVVNSTNVDAAGAVMNSDTSTSGMGFVIDEDSFATDSATKVPTQQSTKAYVTSSISTAGALKANLASPAFTGTATFVNATFSNWPTFPSTLMERAYAQKGGIPTVYVTYNEGADAWPNEVDYPLPTGFFYTFNSARVVDAPVCPWMDLDRTPLPDQWYAHPDAEVELG